MFKQIIFSFFIIYSLVGNTFSQKASDDDLQLNTITTHKRKLLLHYNSYTSELFHDGSMPMGCASILFCLRPDEIGQPTGPMNFSVIDNPALFLKINDAVNEFYDPSNNYIKPTNFGLNKDNKSFYYNKGKIRANDNLYINYSKKRFIAVDGSIFDVNGNLINNESIKESKNGHYGSMLIINCYDIVTKIPIIMHLCSSREDLKKTDLHPGSSR